MNVQFKVENLNTAMHNDGTIKHLENSLKTNYLDEQQKKKKLTRVQRHMGGITGNRIRNIEDRMEA